MQTTNTHHTHKQINRTDKHSIILIILLYDNDDNNR